MGNGKKSKYSNRAMQQLNLNKEKKELVKRKNLLPENSPVRKIIEESIVKIENEIQFFGYYVKQVDDCILRDWLNNVYINKTINLINDTNERRAFQDYRKDNPINNPYNPQQVEQAKKILCKALINKEYYSELDLEKAISNLDDSECRVIARLRLIQNKNGSEIDRLLFFSHGSSVRKLKNFLEK